MEFSPAVRRGNNEISQYTAVMVPPQWKLKQCSDRHIFQDLLVTDIIRQVLSPATLHAEGIKGSIDFRLDTTGTYQQREFCIQYNESDFDFISRLCENEGIFYFFEHQKGRHTLVFADAAGQVVISGVKIILNG